MKEKILNFWLKSDKFFLLPILFTALTAFSIIFLILIFSPRLPSQLPLFYSQPWGKTQLGGKEQFFLLPTILMLISLINSFIASQLHPLQSVLKKILMLSLVFINLIILTTAIKIILIFI